MIYTMPLAKNYKNRINRIYTPCKSVFNKSLLVLLLQYESGESKTKELEAGQLYNVLQILVIILM